MATRFANSILQGTHPARRRADLRQLAFVFVVNGLLALAGAAAIFLVQREAHRGRAVEGTVVEWVQESPRHPIVRYAGPSGVPVEAPMFDRFEEHEPRVGERLALVAQPGRSGEQLRLDRRPGNLVPVAALSAFGLAGLLVYGLFRRHARRSEAYVAELRRRGDRKPVRAFETGVVATKGARWGIVAEWVDGLGRPQRTVASGYDYDPACLLTVERIVVLADGSDPSGARIDPELLPSPFRHRLGAADRAHVDAVAPIPRLQRIVQALAIAGCLGLFAYGLARTWQALD